MRQPCAVDYAWRVKCAVDVLTTGKAVWFLLMIPCSVCKYMLKQESLFATLKKSPYLCSAKPERNAGLESLADRKVPFRE